MRVLGIAFVAIAFSVVPLCEEASYEGRSARYWADRVAADWTDREKAEEAVLAIGAPCVRRLLEHERGWSVISAMGDRATPALLAELRSGRKGPRLAALGALLWHQTKLADGFLEALPALLTDDDAEVRGQATFVLSNAGLRIPEAVPNLLHDLASEWPSTRAFAAAYLDHYPRQAAVIVPRLIAVSSDSDDSVARLALGSLASYWDRAAARAAILGAYASPEPARRRAAVRALSFVPEPPPDVCARCLRAVDDAPVREVALEALERLWLDREVPFGRSALAHRDAEVRKMACFAAQLYDKTARPDLLAVFKDRDENVRRAALDAAKGLGDKSPTVIRALSALVETEPESAEALRAAWILVHLDRRVDWALSFLVERGYAVEAAAAVGPRARVAIPFLRELLDSSDCGDAGWALYIVTGDAGPLLRLIRAALEHRGRIGSRGAWDYAARLGPAAHACVPLLRRSLNPDWDCRGAASALGYIRAAARPAIPELIALLDCHGGTRRSKYNSVSRHAAAALAYLDVASPKIEALLRAVIRDWNGNDGKQRPGALRYMWKHRLMPVDDVVDRCLRSLEPLNWDDALPIIDLLGEIGPAARSAIPALEGRCRARYEIRTVAERALARIRGD